MKENMSNIDRIVRILIAVVAAVLYYNGTLTGTIGIVAVVIAVIFVLTSLINTCPLYSIFGISTRKKEG